jgi:hypothetical protein
MRSTEEAFAAYYASMSDDELLRVAANRESLVPIAQTVLAAQLAKRALAAPTASGQPDTGRWWWPEISGPESATQAATLGAMTSFIVAGVIALLAIVSMFKPLDSIGPSSFVEALLLAFFGFMIKWKISRVAAVAALTLFLGERIYAAVAHGIGPATVLLAAIVLLGFISGVRGTFAYHAYREGSSA